MNANRRLMQMLRGSVGMVIPVWFPAELLEEQVRESLLTTLEDCDHWLPWEQILLVVDGDERSYRVAQKLQSSCRQRHDSTFELLVNAQNRGKGYAISLGVRWFLERPHLRYLTIRDADGDHALNDLFHLFRLAIHLQETEHTETLIIVGRRNHPHRSLGLIRGEYETLLNRVLVEAVKFALARQEAVLNTKYFSLHGDYPDLHSGYKLYSRTVCERMIQAPWERPPWVGADIYRYGVEAVPFVEGVLAEAVVGEITRLSQEPQFTGHGGFARPETNAGVMLWAFLRLGIGPDQGMAILDNQLARLTLWTDPRSREDLLRLRRAIHRSLLLSAQQSDGPADLKTGVYF